MIGSLLFVSMIKKINNFFFFFFLFSGLSGGNIQYEAEKKKS